MGIDACMFVKLPGKVTPADLKEKAFLLASCFGKDRFFIFKEEQRHCLHEVTRYQQDGPDVFPETGGSIIEVSLWTRYWSKDYARGDLPLILAISRWLEFHFPTGQVYYGGDSSGVVATLLDEKERKKLWTAFCLDQNSYGKHFSSGECPICNFCEQPMLNDTWFGRTGATGWHCPGCGELAYKDREGNSMHFDHEKDYTAFAELQRGKGNV